MLDKKVSELLNDQINKELYSAYLYLDFSLYYQEQGLDGFANWYMIQTQDERCLLYTSRCVLETGVKAMGTCGNGI